MKREPKWVTLKDCLVFHDLLLARFGGLKGVRDYGLLESAVHRPLQRYNYEKPTLFELASDYAYGIVKNHPFIDGNKRTGFMAAVLFLEINDCEFIASEELAVLETLALAAGESDDQHYANFLEQNCRKL